MNHKDGFLLYQPMKNCKFGIVVFNSKFEINISLFSSHKFEKINTDQN